MVFEDDTVLYINLVFYSKNKHILNFVEQIYEISRIFISIDKFVSDHIFCSVVKSKLEVQGF